MPRSLPLLLVCLSLPLSALAEEPDIDTKLKAKADSGDTSSQIMIGMMSLQSGDFDSAESWYLKALKGGDKDAEEYLATFYDYPDNPKNDAQKAFKWRCIVAERGESNSQVLLGEMYEQGNGVKQSYRDAANWYRKAAEQGDITGASGLSRMYSDGLGVRQDDVEAYVWARLSEEWQKQSRENTPKEVKARLLETDTSASKALAMKLSASKLRRADTQFEKLLAEIPAQWARERKFHEYVSGRVYEELQKRFPKSTPEQFVNPAETVVLARELSPAELRKAEAEVQQQLAEMPDDGS